MKPLTVLAAQKLSDRFTTAAVLTQQIAAAAAAANVTVPPIDSGRVLLSSATPEMGDENLDESYPRICIYSTAIKNSQFEKFRSFSGQIALTAEIWASADLLSDVDRWIHFYVEGAGAVLQTNVGNWGDGMFFTGSYEVHFQAPKAGGLGFVQAARLLLNLVVSLN